MDVEASWLAEICCLTYVAKARLMEIETCCMTKVRPSFSMRSVKTAGR